MSMNTNETVDDVNLTKNWQDNCIINTHSSCQFVCVRGFHFNSQLSLL